MSIEEQTAAMKEEGFEEVPGTDGGLLKKILTAGSGACPNKKDMVKVHYVGTLHSDGSKFDSSRDRDGHFDFQVGVGAVIKGWDEGICTMLQGELCILRCRSDYAYGDRGSPPTIPPGAILNFEVELFDFHAKEKEAWEMSDEERVASAEAQKAKGNASFKEGQWVIAQMAYAKGVTYFEKQSTQDAAKDLYLACLLNSAQANLKLNETAAAISDCTSALNFDETSIKAYFRRGQAFVKDGKFDAAKVDFQKALEVDPENKDVASELKKCSVAQKKAAEKEKALYGRMGGMFGK